MTNQHAIQRWHTNTMTFVPSVAFASSRPALPYSRCRADKRYDRNPGACLSFPAFHPPTNSNVGTTSLCVADGTAEVVFEPVVNIPALGSFLFIAIVFSFLILRVRAVEQAVERRKAALSDLRQVKSAELSSSSAETRPDADTVKRALQEYQDALKSEDELRTLIPGVRVVAPNQPAGANEEDVAAARQFLGIDLDSAPKEEEEKKGLSTGSVAILAVVALSQIALLYMLSFDPMETYNSFGGPPPADIPPSSW